MQFRRSALVLALGTVCSLARPAFAFDSLDMRSTLFRLCSIQGVLENFKPDQQQIDNCPDGNGIVLKTAEQGGAALKLLEAGKDKANSPYAYLIHTARTQPDFIELRDTLRLLDQHARCQNHNSPGTSDYQNAGEVKQLITNWCREQKEKSLALIAKLKKAVGMELKPYFTVYGSDKKPAKVDFQDMETCLPRQYFPECYDISK